MTRTNANGIPLKISLFIVFILWLMVKKHMVTQHMQCSEKGITNLSEFQCTVHCTYNCSHHFKHSIIESLSVTSITYGEEQNKIDFFPNHHFFWSFLFIFNNGAHLIQSIRIHLTLSYSNLTNDLNIIHLRILSK